MKTVMTVSLEVETRQKLDAILKEQGYKSYNLIFEAALKDFFNKIAAEKQAAESKQQKSKTK